MPSPAASAIKADYSHATAAAQAACAAQHWPPGALYMVATPIGNLADITLRALFILQHADVLACEDTRHTAQMLRAYGIAVAPGRLLAVHQHNEYSTAHTVLAHLHQGRRVVYVSDAGTPAISDPGARLAAAVQQAGLRVVPVPGASSVLAALCSAGVCPPAHSNGVAGLEEGWVFAGFLPPKAQERQRAIRHLHAEPRAVVLLEAAHRMQALADALVPLAQRPITLARELTKQFETIATMPAQQVADWLRAAPERSKGEFVVVLHPARAHAPAAAAAEPLSAEHHRILHLLLAELPTKSAVKLAVDITGAARNALYDAALAVKKET